MCWGAGAVYKFRLRLHVSRAEIVMFFFSPHFTDFLTPLFINGGVQKVILHKTKFLNYNLRNIFVLKSLKNNINVSSVPDLDSGVFWIRIRIQGL